MTAPALSKRDFTVYFGKKGIIASAANIGSGVDLGSPLPDYYSAGLYNPAP
jgi:hypothetical protein